VGNSRVAEYSSQYMPKQFQTLNHWSSMPKVAFDWQGMTCY